MSFHDQLQHLFRRESTEKLSPVFSDPRRTLRKQGATFGLVSTIVGGGVLSLPFAFSKTGLVLGAALLLFSAAASDFTVQLLVLCARRTGAQSYEELALHAFGRTTQALVVTIIAALTWISTIAYFVLVGDMLAPVAHVLGLHLGRQGVMIGVAIGVCPLCMLRSLHALRFTSVLCVVAVLALAGCIAYKSIADGYAFAPAAAAAAPAGTDLTVLVWPRSAAAAFSGTLHALPIFCVSFLCHFNVLSTHTELHAPSQGRIAAVVHQTMLLCTLLYLTVGVLGYLHRLGGTHGDVLQNFRPGDGVINGGRVALALVLCFSLPLLVLPCRDALLRLLTGLPAAPPDDGAHDGALLLQPAPPLPLAGNGGGGALGALRQPLMQPLKQPHAGARAAHAGAAPLSAALDAARRLGAWAAARVPPRAPERALLSASVLGSALLCALAVPDVVSALMGSSIALLVAFILPALFFLKLRAHKPWRTAKLAAVSLLLLSAYLAVVGTQQAIRQARTNSEA